MTSTETPPAAPPADRTVTPEPVIPEPAAPAPSSLEDFDSKFSDLDETPPTPEPAPAPEPKPAPAKDPVSGKFLPKGEVKPEPVKPAPAPVPAKPAVKPEAAPAPVNEFEPPSVATNSQLRTWAKQAGARAQKADSELKRMQSQLVELQKQPQVPADYQAVTAELAATKKRLEAHEGELRVTRYERSSEYKEKYEKPYQNAVQAAYGEVKELLVSEPNPDDPENPRERQATGADFDEVYNLPLGPATKLAKSKFGDAAFIVLNHRKAIRDAAKNAVGAVEEHKAKSVEFEQAQTAQQRMIEEGRNTMFSTALQALGEKYPSYFGQRDGDNAWNEALSKGRQMADLAFSDRRGLTPQQSAILDAQMHSRAAAFGPLRLELEKTKTELAELRKEVEERRSSSPGKPGVTAPDGNKPEITDSIAGIDSLPE